VILKPLDEISYALEHNKYFMVTNYQLLDWEASEAACEGCGISPSFRYGKLTLASSIMGFKKSLKIQQVLKDALSLAQIEKYIAATEPTHRHDQALISLLMYKHFGDVNIANGSVYAGWQSPTQIVGQKVWVHRRGLSEKSASFLAAHISSPLVKEKKTARRLGLLAISTFCLDISCE
jgi:hypothetical protein